MISQIYQTHWLPTI